MTLMKNMTWYEFNERKDKDIVILPVGSVEQHGPHLPLYTDTIISEGFSIGVNSSLFAVVARAELEEFAEPTSALTVFPASLKI